MESILGMRTMWDGFSEAGIESILHSSAIRPSSDEFEEGRVIKGQKKVFAPSLDEYEAHMRTHIAFRRFMFILCEGKSQESGSCECLEKC